MVKRTTGTKKRARQSTSVLAAATEDEPAPQSGYRTRARSSVAVSTMVAKGDTAIRRIPASGRWWKQCEMSRSSSAMLKNKSMGTSWKAKVSERARKKHLKELEREILAGKQARREQEIERIKAKRARKAENQLRGMQLREITPEKLKKMNKRQLRRIKKTAVDKDGNVVLKPIYS